MYTHSLQASWAWALATDCIYIHIFPYMHIYTCEHICVYTYLCILTKCVYAHTYIHIHVYTGCRQRIGAGYRLSKYTYSLIDTHTLRVHIHMRMHIHVHIHKHIQAANDLGIGAGYGLSKAALTSLTMIHAKNYPNLMVTSVHPGVIDTLMTKGFDLPKLVYLPSLFKFLSDSFSILTTLSISTRHFHCLSFLTILTLPSRASSLIKLTPHWPRTLTPNW